MKVSLRKVVQVDLDARSEIGRCWRADEFTIAKLRHEQYGQSAERGTILEQLELQLADLEEDASEAEAQAQLAAAAASIRID